MLDYIATAEPMTAGELRKKIRNLPAETPIYLVTDKESPDAWDDERQRWRYAIPLVYVSREKWLDESGYEDDQMAVLLECENP